jgi:hypothetical protein
MWINYPGGAAGSGASGSTENALFGLNHSGDHVIWDNASAAPSDGVWFTVTGEGGSAADYRAYVGGTNSFPIWLPFESSGLAASGAMDANASSEPFQTYFPTPTYESPGAPGKHWVQVEVRQSAENVLSWFMNGNLIAQRINQTGFTNGNIMLGFADLYASLADPVNDSFMLYDNVRVELDTPALLPVITGNPTNQTLLVGQTARLSVDATGIGPINYQWRFNGTNLSGATNQALILPNVGMASTGHYDVLVANAVGSVTSIMAQLNVLPANTNPPILSVVGQGMTLRVTWPSDRIGWRLEMQTNFFTAGQRDHWVTLPDSNATNQMLINIGEFESAFFRLVYP